MCTIHTRLVTSSAGLHIYRPMDCHAKHDVNVLLGFFRLQPLVNAFLWQQPLWGLYVTQDTGTDKVERCSLHCYLLSILCRCPGTSLQLTCVVSWKVSVPRHPRYKSKNMLTDGQCNEIRSSSVVVSSEFDFTRSFVELITKRNGFHHPGTQWTLL